MIFLSQAPVSCVPVKTKGGMGQHYMRVRRKESEDFHWPAHSHRLRCSVLVEGPVSYTGKASRIFLTQLQSIPVTMTLIGFQTPIALLANRISATYIHRCSTWRRGKGNDACSLCRAYEYIIQEACLHFFFADFQKDSYHNIQYPRRSKFYLCATTTKIS